MREEHLVIIGNGPAGTQAAFTLREKRPDARITMMDKERLKCYKPNLLPEYIAGKVPEDKLYVSPLELYKSKGIKLRLGQKVVDVNLENKEITLDHKEIIRFSGLILAVGGKPRIPEPLHPYKDLMFTLKTIADARRWIQELDKVDSVLIIGGDLTSFAVAKALLHVGKEVRFILNEDAFWPVRYNKEIYEQAAHQLTQKGVEVLACRKLKGVGRLSEQVLQVQVDDRKIESGMVGAFFGLLPDVKFLTQSGLQIERGVLADEYLNTGFEGVYAAGDCAEIYHPEIRDYWVSIGYDNAVNLGRIAALNLVGGKVQVDVEPESIFFVERIRANISWWMEF
ncbi:MAG: pyridine nucleotide-disulfide oxidoreductase [Nitrospira bacterium SG8_3]|nr:MAG: pyridine nucleotide-disulfide oxidoreductase [Nitrospira bacterium SG8_3]